MTEFELTTDHLKLIQNMYTEWSDIEYGAPAIDPKRPYGNSFVAEDIFEILGWELTYPDEMTNAQSERAYKIHRETQTVLQIILVTQSFEPGRYVKQDMDDDREWVRA